MPGTAVVEDPEETNAHRRALEVLQRAGIEPMVGGAYALRAHTGIWRDTKDLDLFVRKDQIEQALDVLAHAGYRTELTDPLW
ncbi:MAG TPA: nucleotidyltransferase, partial [Myxococcales bacterium]|nr:nucleotidyltransferase [Myxococcales bacterium]